MNIKDVANTPDKHRDTLIAIARAGDGRWPELRRKLLAAGVDEGWLYNLELDAREHHEVAREERLARPEPESMGTDPDLLRRELEKKFADYLSLVLEAPQHLDAETLLELLEEHHETFRAQREIATPAERALSGVSSVGRLFGADFFDQNNKPPRRKVLLEQRDMNEQPAPFLPLGKVGLFVSPGGVGKTTVLSQLAISVATGLPWLGFEVASPGKVFLGLGEEDKDEVHRRLHDAGNLYGLGDKDDAHNPMAPSMARAREELLKLALTDDRVLDDPEPVTFVSSLDDSSVGIGMRVWCSTPDYLGLSWDMTEAVKARFDDVGISIPFPQREIVQRAA